MITTGWLLALTLAMGPPVQGNLARDRAQKHVRDGQDMMRSEQYEEAVGEFRKAVELDPLLMLAHYNLGQSYMALKRYPDAVKAYLECEDAVIRLSSMDMASREERDRENRDEIQDLKSLSRTLESEASRQAGPGNSAAMTDAQVVRIEERIRMLEGMRLKGQEIMRVPPEVYVGLGSAYFRQNNLKDAEAAYGKAVAGNNKLGAAHNNLAVIYMLSGRFPEANASINAAEKAGFRVDPRLKADLKSREGAAK
jgi:tetratricopeptide (TPR) repeat protein